MSTPLGLSGVRIWLSGSIPSEASDDEAAHLRSFVTTFATECFRNGAELVHGCHPSLMPTLLEAARGYRERTQRRATLTALASAEYRSPDGTFPGLDVVALGAEATFRVTPAMGNKDQSLVRLRDSLAAEADVLVAVGGKWWREAPIHAGVPAELNLAVSRGIPSFLVGGLGGSAAGYLEDRPEILRSLRNGMDLAQNQALARETRVEVLVTTILEQAARLPIGRRETAGGQRFRILCLDGGGIRGVFTASILARWEAMTRLSAASHFDLIAGTSTGGILAVGLGLGLSAQSIVEFYCEHGPEIFPMTSLAQRTGKWFSRIFVNKFDAKVLEEKLGLAYAPGERTLAESHQRLLITSYNVTSDSLRIYRTSHHPSVSGHDHLAAVTVARATSAAPTFFKTAVVDDPLTPHEAVDGGVWANCPTIAALAEAVGVLGVPLDRIEMLSLGTTSSPSLVGVPRLLSGLVGWATRAPDLLLKAQGQASLRQAEQLLGPARFLRVDDSAQTKDLDDVRAIPVLRNKGSEVAERTYEDVRERFLNGVRAAPWR